MASTKRIVLSDLHFGDPLCSLHRTDVQSGLLDFLRSQGNIAEIVFAGDILDANISSLTRAIEGFPHNGERYIGFRAWLASVAALPGCKTTELVYVPGSLGVRDLQHGELHREPPAVRELPADR